MLVGPNTPVLIGVGAVSQRLDEPGAGLDDTGMIVEAARRAVTDSGSRPIRSRIGWIGSTRGLGGRRDAGREVASVLGVEAHTVVAEAGIPQQTLVNMALVAISAGEVDAAVVCGGEAKWRADNARRAGLDPVSDRSPIREAPDEELVPSGEMIAAPEIAIGAAVPVQQYAMIENARRAANGWSIDEHLDGIAELWHRFNVIAGTHPAAAFPQRRSLEAIRDPGPDNRPLAFPYNRWHVSQGSVDQSAALLLCSAGTAADCGVPKDRWVFPHVGLESSHSLSLSRRRDLHRWPAMRVLGEAAHQRIGRPVSDMEYLELYSCSPSAVRVQQTELGIDAGRTPTVTGGMTFAGGPFNNFVYQATVAMAQRLRSDPGSFGVVTAVSGLLAKPALAVWSGRPPAKPVMVVDLVVEAAAATEEVPLDESPDGRGSVVTYTVVPVGHDPARVCVIVDLDSGARGVAAIDDPELATSAMADELIGRRVLVKDTEMSI